MDLGSRLRAIVRGTGQAPAAGPPQGPVRELTYEPDGGYEATVRRDQLEALLGARTVPTPFGDCVAIDRRYESDRRHGDVQVGECELADSDALRLLDPALEAPRVTRAVFIDLETTGLTGGAGTVAFLVGCGYFDLGAFQVRQFLLTSHAGERAMLAAVAEFVGAADLIVTYNGKTFDIPVMETRWSFHRLTMPLDGVPHFDMLHAARRLWGGRVTRPTYEDGGCRLGTLERALLDYRRVGDVPGSEIPSRYFRFLRTGDPRPLEPVLEHNRLDLVSLAAVTARAARLARQGPAACRDSTEALALGRVLERAGEGAKAEACYRRATACDDLVTRAEALYRLGLWLRRTKHFEQAALCWRTLVDVPTAAARRNEALRVLRQFAIEALAIHNEHRTRDLATARELALFALEETAGDVRRAEGVRHRLARLDRKLAKGGTPDPAQITLLPAPAASSPSLPPCGFQTSAPRNAS